MTQDRSNGIPQSSVVTKRGDLQYVDGDPKEDLAAYDRLPPAIRSAIREIKCDTPAYLIEPEYQTLVRRYGPRLATLAIDHMVRQIHDAERRWLSDQPSWWNAEMAEMQRRLALARRKAAA